MKWLEITVTTAPTAVEAAGDALFQSRVGGIEELPAGERTVRLRAYLPAGPGADATVAAIRARIAALPQYGLDVGPGAVAAQEVDDEEWSEAWKEHFKPFAVGRLWITPSWDDTPSPAGTVAVTLDPGMAFGSGYHPSTRMCLELLDRHIRGGEVVFDVGTGSGILAIAAARLGAVHVLAVDVDPLAVRIAQGNVRDNGVADRVDVREGELLTAVPGRADIIVANLTADLHLAFLPSVRSHLQPHGLLAASGLVADRLPEVAGGARRSGLRAVATVRSGEWRCLVLSPEA